MARPTWRVKLLTAGAALIAATVIVLLFAGQHVWAAVGSTFLLLLTLALLVDLRRRSQIMGRQMRRLGAAVVEVEALRDSVEDLRLQSEAQRTAAAEGWGRVLKEVRLAREEFIAAEERLHREFGSVFSEVVAIGESGARRAAGEAEEAASRHREEMSVLRQLLHEPVTQVQALHQLASRLGDVSARMPLLGGWAMDATTVLFLIEFIAAHRPKVVLECGSGSSTVWVAEALRQVGQGKIVSMEHSQEYAAATQAELAERGLTDWAEVRYAPLTNVLEEDSGLRWYDPAVIEDVKRVDALIIDGPPRTSGRLARYPALPVLAPILGSGATIVLDDAWRSDETAIVKRWEEEGYVSAGGRRLLSAVILSAADRSDA